MTKRHLNKQKKVFLAKWFCGIFYILRRLFWGAFTKTAPIKKVAHGDGGKNILPIVGNEVINHAGTLWKTGRWKRNYPLLWHLWKRVEMKWRTKWPNGFPKYLVRSALLFTVILLVGTFSRLSLHAEAAKFYPSACLGGWQNTGNAEGKPDLSETASTEDFTDKNSAVLDNILSQIFCSGFSGEIPKDSEIKTLRLKFSWSPEGRISTEAPFLKEASGNSSISSEESTTTITVYKNDEASSRIQKILDAPDESVLKISTEDTPPLVHSSQSATSEQTETTSDSPVPTIESTAEPSLESAPVSFFERLFSQAFAEEQSNDAVAEQATTSTGEITQETASTSPVIFSSEILEVLYTIDGKEWHSLGKVKEGEWKNEFEIPVSMWADISKLQVSVQSILNMDKSPKIYLDGMWLEAEYENSVPKKEIQTEKGQLSAVSSSFGYADVATSTKEDKKTVPIDETRVEGLSVENENANQHQSNEEPPTPVPVLSVRKLQKDVVIDAMAAHRCEAEDFRIDISGKDSAAGKIVLKKDTDAPYEAEIGSLPDGISVVFSANKRHGYSISSSESILDLEITNESGSQRGSFSIPIIYTKKGSRDSSVICQINIVNQ